MSFIKTTEQTSKYDHLDKMSVRELLTNINNEDKTVPFAVEKAIPQIEILVTQVITKMKTGGRLFYIGAGTSGRLGVVDASECPPTFGVDFEYTIQALEYSAEDGSLFAEDDKNQAWKDLQAWNINENDVVIGIAASGTTPYVIGGLQKCNENLITTGSISCNANSPLSQTANYPIDVIVGPEFVTGSSRMKAGTAQKLVLNMISTTTMIALGKVKGNKMVDMQLSNDKLIDRGIRMIMDEIPVSYETGEKLLQEHGNVRKAVDFYNCQK